jgi:hypothetical protein
LVQFAVHKRFTTFIPAAGIVCHDFETSVKESFDFEAAINRRPVCQSLYTLLSAVRYGNVSRTARSVIHQRRGRRIHPVCWKAFSPQAVFTVLMWGTVIRPGFAAPDRYIRLLRFSYWNELCHERSLLLKLCAVP